MKFHHRWLPPEKKLLTRTCFVRMHFDKNINKFVTAITNQFKWLRLSKYLHFFKQTQFSNYRKSNLRILATVNCLLSPRAACSRSCCRCGCFGIDRHMSRGSRHLLADGYDVCDGWSTVVFQRQRLHIPIINSIFWNILQQAAYKYCTIFLLDLFSASNNRATNFPKDFKGVTLHPQHKIFRNFHVKRSDLIVKNPAHCTSHLTRSSPISPPPPVTPSGAIVGAVR